MTVPTTINRVSYAGNGATTAFSFPYYFLRNADLIVVRRDAVGTETTYTLGVDYTVSGAGNPAGGIVTTTVAPPAGTSLFIIRDPAIIQDVDYVPQSRFPAESHERALDKAAMIDIRLRELVAKALRTSETDTGADAYRAFGRRIGNMANGTFATDAATVGQVTALGADLESRAMLLNGSNAWDGRGKRLTALGDGTADTDASTLRQLYALRDALIGQAPTGTAVHASRLAAALTSPDSGVSWLATSGYAAAGDGGQALYKRVASEPTHPGKFQTANGVWWEIAEIVFRPAMFGATGDGVADDTAALSAAVSTVIAFKRTLLISRPHLISSALPVIPGDVTIEFVGAGKLKAPANATGFTMLRVGHGHTLLTRSLGTTAAALFDGQISFSNVDGIVPGSILRLQHDATVNNPRGFVTMIKNRTATTGAGFLVLENVIPYTVPANTAFSVCLVVPPANIARNVHIRNAVLEATGNTSGVMAGIYVLGAEGCTFSGRATNFRGGGIIAGSVIRCGFDFNLDFSGYEPGGEASWPIYAATECSFRGYIYRGNYFGTNFDFCHSCHFQITAKDGAGRCIKMLCVTDSWGEFHVENWAGQGYSGQGGTSRNDFRVRGRKIIASTGGFDGTGFNLNDTGSINNTFRLDLRGIAGTPFGQGPTDTGNFYPDWYVEGPLSMSITGNPIIRPRIKHYAKAHRGPNAAMSLPVGVYSPAIPFGTTVSDANGLFSGTTFTAKVPGRYRVTAKVRVTLGGTSATTHYIAIFQNGATPATNKAFNGPATGDAEISDHVELTPAETIDIRILNGHTAAGTAEPNVTTSVIEVELVS